VLSAHYIYLFIILSACENRQITHDIARRRVGVRAREEGLGSLCLLASRHELISRSIEVRLTFLAQIKSEMERWNNDDDDDDDDDVGGDGGAGGERQGTREGGGEKDTVDFFIRIQRSFRNALSFLSRKWRALRELHASSIGPRNNFLACNCRTCGVFRIVEIASTPFIAAAK
jgi:hypothetical protein